MSLPTVEEIYAELERKKANSVASLLSKGLCELLTCEIATSDGCEECMARDTTQYEYSGGNAEEVLRLQKEVFIYVYEKEKNR